MKMLRNLVLFVVVALGSFPAFAQYQVPNHATPVGRGLGYIGYGSFGPCSAGIPFVGAGVSADPTCAQLGSAGIAPSAVQYGNIQNESASTLLGNPTGSAASPSEVSLGAGLKFSGSTVVNTVPPSFIGAYGLLITNDAGSPTTAIDVTAAQFGAAYSGSFVYATNVSVVINTTTTGANGLDTGSRAANTWYNIFLINNGTTTAGLASLSATSPTLPTGYNYFVASVPS